VHDYTCSFGKTVVRDHILLCRCLYSADQLNVSTLCIHLLRIEYPNPARKKMLSHDVRRAYTAALVHSRHSGRSQFVPRAFETADSLLDTLTHRRQFFLVLLSSFLRALCFSSVNSLPLHSLCPVCVCCRWAIAARDLRRDPFLLSCRLASPCRNPGPSPVHTAVHSPTLHSRTVRKSLKRQISNSLSRTVRLASLHSGYILCRGRLMSLALEK
jgi:hypothetical protein